MGESLFAVEHIPVQFKGRQRVVKNHPDFPRFWAAWPQERRVEKVLAKTEFDIAMTKTTIEVILQALAQKRWSADPQFIVHPHRWLKRERWNDEEIQGDPVLRAVGL